MKSRLVHLVTDPLHNEKEKKSVENLQSFCTQYPVEYKQCINVIYKDLPPVNTCNRPGSVNMEPGGSNLSPGHYGCFLAHKNGICLPDNIDYDFILVFEDSYISKDFDLFYNNLSHYYNIIKNEDLEIFNLGNNQGPGYTFEKEKEDYIIGNKFFIPAHSYMIPRDKLRLIQFKLNTCLWDAYDLWITQIAKLKTGCSKTIYTKHCSGYSFVDKCVKVFE